MVLPVSLMPLCHSQNVKEIYYQDDEDKLEVETPAAEPPSSEASPTPTAVAIVYSPPCSVRLLEVERQT